MKKSKILQNAKFVYEIAVKAVPHTKESSGIIYGDGAYNPDFPVDTHASDIIGTVLQDSVTSCFSAISKHFARCKCDFEDMSAEQKLHHMYLKKKLAIAEYVQSTLKLIRVEELAPEDQDYKLQED
jgi:hypothetical protein